MSDYRPAEYWENRLEADTGLRGTGHISYDESYNVWMYRHKGSVLRSQLSLTADVGRALDIGSGTGWVMQQLIESGASSVDGCDISAPVAERLRERFPASTIHHHSMGEKPLPIDDRSYDTVTMLDVSYHITDESLFESTVADLARVLRPGGSLLITDGLGPADVVPSVHVRFRAEERWREAAESHGMRLDRVVPLYRWLSRDRQQSRLRRLPDRVRGMIEFGLERVPATRPHMQFGVLVGTEA